MKVLVVDDSVSVRKALERILQGHELEVVTAGNAEEALQILPSSGPDLIIADVVMPGMDGFELCRNLKAHPGFQRLPTLLISGIVNEDVLRQAREAGAADIVKKPFTPEDLLPKVEKALARETVPEGGAKSGTSRTPGFSQASETAEADAAEETDPSFSAAELSPSELVEAHADDAHRTAFDADARAPDAPTPGPELLSTEDETAAALRGQLEPFLDHPAVDAAMLVNAKGRPLATVGAALESEGASLGLAVYVRTLSSIAGILGEHLELPAVETLHLDYGGQSVLITKLSASASLLLLINDSSAFSVVRYLIRKQLPELLETLG